MTILGISLLRLGDLILQRPLIEELRKRHPHSEIHLLVNKQFAQVEFLFKGLVDKFLYFDRDVLQKSCGEKEYNIMWGFHQLKMLVEEVNRTNYDTVYNFTHNRLTAHMMGLITAREKVGIYSKGGQFYGLSNPWILFFNNYFGKPEAMGFHYTELLGRALDIPVHQAAAKLSLPRMAKKILIQPLTSDTKKNWGLERYRHLVTALELKTSLQVQVLGAPFEREALEKVFARQNLLICDLEEVVQAFAETALVISGDTSIKHLAALYDTPILEISLGSSQPLQTGAFANQSVILQPRVHCGPCPHSQPCSQPLHLCADRLSVATVIEASLKMVGPESGDWSRFAEDHPELTVLKTEIRHLMGWTVHCLSMAQKDYFDQILQKKTMIVEELNRRHQAVKGVTNEQRTRKLPDNSIEAP